MKSSRTSLFLMELIISILFFSLAGAACIQFFVKAHLLNLQAKEQNKAASWSQNLAELWTASDADMPWITEQLTVCFDAPKDTLLLSADEKTLRLFFDSDWQLCHEADAAYFLTFTNNGYNEETLLLNAEVTLQKSSEIFYSLSLVHHPALERGTLYE